MADKRSGEVWLEGALERGVVPEECAWTVGGGPGEDGCLLLLQKMNLELLRRCARISPMPRQAAEFSPAVQHRIMLSHPHKGEWSSCVSKMSCSYNRKRRAVVPAANKTLRRASAANLQAMRGFVSIHDVLLLFQGHRACFICGFQQYNVLHT